MEYFSYGSILGDADFKWDVYSFGAFRCDLSTGVCNVEIGKWGVPED